MFRRTPAPATAVMGPTIRAPCRGTCITRMMDRSPRDEGRRQPGIEQRMDGRKGLRSSGLRLAMVVALGSVRVAMAADWSRRLITSTTGSAIDDAWTGQQRQYLELTARGPMFMEDQGALSLSLERLSPLHGGAAAI